jgi:PhoPQ-activated pathogenicity-related protein
VHPVRISLSLFAAGFLMAGSLAPSEAGPRPGKTRTALDRYVAAPDAAYRYKLVSSKPGEGYTTYVLELISQEWRKPSEVNRTRWEHWLTLVQPAEVRGQTGFLFIGGGSNPSSPPAGLDPFLTRMAVQTKTVVAELKMVPNEPLTFPDDGMSRTEDEIIAYTWDKYLRGGDDNWPLRLPMTKSAVRAMDTIIDFCKAPERGSARVEKFVVSGGSKRGWTTWCTAAVDDRVVGIVPAVIDVLNLEPSMRHHFQAYGFWAPAVGDYTAMKLTERGGTARYKKLMEIEDPYSYRDRLTMPKLIMNSTGDEYFVPDSWKFYWDGLRGEKHLRYVPNTKHNLRGATDAREALQAFYEAVLNDRARPRYSWKLRDDGSILVRTKDKPLEVKLWQANNPKARDFRLDTIGPAYKSSKLDPEPGKENTYVARIPAPAQGWTAFFVELTFPSGGTFPFTLTTGVHVLPDTLPHPPPRQSE